MGDGAVPAALLLALAATSVAWPAAAVAGQLTMTNGILAYNADVGEPNDLEVSGELGGNVTFAEGVRDVDYVTEDTTCAAAGRGQRCSLTAIRRIVITLQDVGDALFIDLNAPGVAIEVDGGPGDDNLTGGPNDEDLQGGSGHDAINGRSGTTSSTQGHPPTARGPTRSSAARASTPSTTASEQAALHHAR